MSTTKFSYGRYLFFVREIRSQVQKHAGKYSNQDLNLPNTSFDSSNGVMRAPVLRTRREVCCSLVLRRDQLMLWGLPLVSTARANNTPGIPYNHVLHILISVLTQPFTSFSYSPHTYQPAVHSTPQSLRVPIIK